MLGRRVVLNGKEFVVKMIGPKGKLALDRGSERRWRYPHEIKFVRGDYRAPEEK